MRQVTYIIVALLFISCSNENSKVGLKTSSITAPVTNNEKSDNTTSKTSVISGEVFYRERIALPPGSILTISLEDVSTMDSSSTIIAKKTMILNSAPPYKFKLEYPQNKIKDKFNYTIRAKIENNGRLLFTTTEYIDPFATHGKHLKIMMQKIQTRQTNEAKDNRSSQFSENLQNTKWMLERLGDATPINENSQIKPFFQIINKDKIVSGFSGCNNFTGKYTNKNNGIKFGPLAVTQKQCTKRISENENRFLSALENSHYFTISNDKLVLLAKDKKILAIFKAKH